MINPLDFFKIKNGLGRVSADHPKLFPFMRAVSAAGAKEGTIVEMKVTTPEGKELETNLRLTANDIEVFRMLRELGGAMSKEASQDSTLQQEAVQQDSEGTDQ